MKIKTPKILKNKHFNWILVVVYAGLIFYMSSKPYVIPALFTGGFFERLANYSIKIGAAHFLEFAILSLLLFRALHVSKIKNAAVYAVIIAVIYAASDEIHQLFVPNRVCDIIDFSFDALGAIAVQTIGKIKLLFLK